jgi:hypothetical protein
MKQQTKNKVHAILFFLTLIGPILTFLFSDVATLPQPKYVYLIHKDGSILIGHD